MDNILLFGGLVFVAIIVFWFTKKEDIAQDAHTILAKQLKSYDNPLAKKICMRLSISKNTETFVSYRFMSPIASFEYKIRDVSLKVDLSKTERKEIENVVNDVDTLVYVGALYYRYLFNCVRVNRMPSVLISVLQISKELFYKECLMLCKVDYSKDAEHVAKALFEQEDMFTWDRYELLMNGFILVRKDFKLNKVQYRLLENDIKNYLCSWLQIHQADTIAFLKHSAKRIENL